MTFIKASEAEVGQTLVMSANASGGAPDVGREILSIEVDDKHGLIGFALEGGKGATYPKAAQIEVVA